MQYKIGDLAYLFSLSAESIRHYERQGLIHPQKSEGSPYRHYSAWDLAVLSACRHYRALGFTLEDSAHMLDNHQPAAVLEDLRAREQEIEQEIARQCRTLRTLRAWRTEAGASCELLGRFELRENVSTLFLPYQYGDALAQDEEQLSCVRDWLRHIPYVYVGMLIPLGSRPDEAPFTVGLCMADVAVGALAPQMHPCILRIPSRLCLHTSLQFQADAFSPEAVIASFSRELDRRGLVPAGEMLCRFNLISWTQGGLGGMLDCFLPVR